MRIAIVIQGGCVEDFAASDPCELTIIDEDMDSVQVHDVEPNAEKLAALLTASGLGCGHKPHEEHLFCSGCGRCSESLDDSDMCADCRGYWR